MSILYVRICHIKCCICFQNLLKSLEPSSRQDCYIEDVRSSAQDKLNAFEVNIEDHHACISEYEDVIKFYEGEQARVENDIVIKEEVSTSLFHWIMTVFV